MVIAYGLEDCSDDPYTFTDRNGLKHTYTMRILIADPNHLSTNGVTDETCIYYDPDDYSWVIPCWNNDTRYCYWNASDGNINHRYIKGLRTFNELTMENLSNTTTVDHYIAGLSIDNIDGNDYSVDILSSSGNPDYDYAGDEGNNGIVSYKNDSDDEFTSDDSENYAFWDPTSSYKLSYSIPSDYDLMMDYKNVNFYAAVTDATYTLFKPTGLISIIDSDMNYEVSIVSNESECVTDWYAVTVSGSGVDNVIYKKVDGGYTISSESSLNVVSIEAYNDDVTATTTFTTNYTEVYLYEIDENTIGVAIDTDGDDTYETDL